MSVGVAGAMSAPSCDQLRCVMVSKFLCLGFVASLAALSTAARADSLGFRFADITLGGATGGTGTDISTGACGTGWDQRSTIGAVLGAFCGLGAGWQRRRP